MELKTATMWGVFIGGTLGGMVPTLWGAGMFSLSSVFFTAVGGILGIYLGYRYVRG
jgi:hypothetical protein